LSFVFISVEMGKIHFFNEDIHFRLKDKKKIRKWINLVIDAERVLIPVNIDFIFCSDQFLLKINQSFLHKDTLTDIISFNLSETHNTIDGEVYISIDRVRENSTIFGSSMKNELRRILIHGVLHLIGYDDKSDTEIQKMRQLENKYLLLFEKSFVPRGTKGFSK
jgi:probable rRNA maturation factor